MHCLIAETAHSHAEFCGSGPLGLGPYAEVLLGTDSIPVPKVLNALCIITLQDLSHSQVSELRIPSAM